MLGFLSQFITEDNVKSDFCLYACKTVVPADSIYPLLAVLINGESFFLHACMSPDEGL